MQAALIIFKIYLIEYFQTIFLYIYNCTYYKTPFHKFSHILCNNTYVSTVVQTFPVKLICCIVPIVF